MKEGLGMLEPNVTNKQLSEKQIKLITEIRHLINKIEQLQHTPGSEPVLENTLVKLENKLFQLALLKKEHK